MIKDVETRISEPVDNDCTMCTMSYETRVDEGFASDSLVILDEQTVETHDDGEAVYNYRTRIIDKATEMPIGFLQLFDPSTTPFAKNAIVEEILAALNRLNSAVSGNEKGDTQYFWNETDANLQAQGDEEWDEMGLFPVVEDGKIIGFKYYADSYEFAPYGSSAYFSGFDISAAPIVAFLKPEYRENFK